MSAKTGSLTALATYQEPVLARYSLQIRQQQQLLTQIKAVLTAALTEHLLAVNVKGKTLYLYVDQTAWIAPLLAVQAAILTAVTGLIEVNRLEIQALFHDEPLCAKKISVPSKDNIQLIRHCSAAIEDDTLKASLLRLSQTLEKLSR